MKKKNINILVINTGSTSTKLALYCNEQKIAAEDIDHERHTLDVYDCVLEQLPMRKEAVMRFLTGAGYTPEQIDVIASRGGAFGIFAGGGYIIDKAVMELSAAAKPGFPATASWLAARIAGCLSTEYGIPAYFYDAVRTDELSTLARYSGLSMIKRKPGAHPLNTKEVGRRVAAQHNERYESMTYLICHLGGGISIELHINGKMVDKICSEEGAFTPERAGNIPNDSLVELCFSGHYTEAEIKKLLRGKGGLLDYLGTSDLREVEHRVNAGDAEALEVVQAMVYMIAKDIGALAAAADGQIDRIIFTGGIAHSEWFTNQIAKKTAFIAPIETVAGSFEMEALAHGVLRILRGEEAARHADPTQA